METSNNSEPVKSQEELLNERMSGKLPVIDIAGHPFYVDVRAQYLRPHDDFSTPGIPFSAFDDHEASEKFAWIPYDPKTHEVKVTNRLEITAIPEDWILIEIQHPWFLDPYAHARDQGFPMEEHLKEVPIQQHLKARIVSWDEVGMPDIIKENLARMKKEERRLKPQQRQQRQDHSKHKQRPKR